MESVIKPFRSYGLTEHQWEKRTTFPCHPRRQTWNTQGQFLDLAAALAFLIRTCSLWTAARGEFMVCRPELWQQGLVKEKNKRVGVATGSRTCFFCKKQRHYIIALAYQSLGKRAYCDVLWLLLTSWNSKKATATAWKLAVEVYSVMGLLFQQLLSDWDAPRAVLSMFDCSQGEDTCFRVFSGGLWMVSLLLNKDTRFSRCPDMQKQVDAWFRTQQTQQGAVFMFSSWGQAPFHEAGQWLLGRARSANFSMSMNK